MFSHRCEYVYMDGVLHTQNKQDRQALRLTVHTASQPAVKCRSVHGNVCELQLIHAHAHTRMLTHTSHPTMHLSTRCTIAINGTRERESNRAVHGRWMLHKDSSTAHSLCLASLCNKSVMSTKIWSQSNKEGKGGLESGVTANAARRAHLEFSLLCAAHSSCRPSSLTHSLALTHTTHTHGVVAADAQRLASHDKMR